MNKRIVKEAASYKVEIFIAGDLFQAQNACRAFCDAEGLCVTVTQTAYVYTGGVENGVTIGLINYPRFPKEQDFIWETAENLAEVLKTALGQGSYTIQDHIHSMFVSTRDQDQ